MVGLWRCLKLSYFFLQHSFAHQLLSAETHMTRAARRTRHDGSTGPMPIPSRNFQSARRHGYGMA
jgi:hypothetical protein